MIVDCNYYPLESLNIKQSVVLTARFCDWIHNLSGSILGPTIHGSAINIIDQKSCFQLWDLVFTYHKGKGPEDTSNLPIGFILKYYWFSIICVALQKCIGPSISPYYLLCAGCPAMDKRSTSCSA